MHRLAILALVTISALAATVSARAQEPLGSITGHVFFEDTGQPYSLLLGAVISVETPQPIPFSGDTGFLYGTDENGMFVVSDLAAGDYLVGMYINPDHVPYLTDSILLSGNLRFPAMIVHVNAGENVSVDFPVVVPDYPTPDPRISLDLLPRGTASISGRVGPDSCDTCFRQEDMLIAPRNLADRVFDLRPISTDSDYVFTTEGSGRYLIVDLAAGEYVLSALLEQDLIGSYSETVKVRTSTGITEYPAVCVRLADGDAVSGVDFIIRLPTPQYAPGGAVSGSDQQTSGVDNNACTPVKAGVAPTPASTPTITLPDAGDYGGESNPWRAAAILAALAMCAFALLASSVLLRLRPPA